MKLIFSTSPSTGTFIILAIFSAFSTIIPTISCGVATTTIPSNGIDWKTVNGTSPVPGGMSTNITSMSFHNVLPQNCFTTSATTVSTKNEYPMLKASIDYDTNVVTYTKPVTSVVDANRVTSTR